MTIKAFISHSREQLNDAGIDSAELDAELIVAYVLACDRATLFAHGENELTEKQEKQAHTLMEKRAARMPLAAIVGHKEFYGFDFIVNRYTLIPRPETELLVQSVIDYCNAHPEKHSIVELGVGSGCVILSILKKCPQLSIAMGIEFVKRALAVAQHNAERLGLLNHITFKRSNMWQQLTPAYRYDIVVGNLPYLSAAELAAARSDCPELSFEPQIALLGGKDGLLYFEKLFQRVHRHLRPGAVIFLEIGALQTTAVSALAQKYLPKVAIDVRKDDCARDRVLVMQT